MQVPQSPQNSPARTDSAGRGASVGEFQRRRPIRLRKAKRVAPGLEFSSHSDVKLQSDTGGGSCSIVNGSGSAGWSE